MEELNQLKVRAYDLIAQIEHLQKMLAETNQQINETVERLQAEQSQLERDVAAERKSRRKAS